jgi:hypothetical protein
MQPEYARTSSQGGKLRFNVLAFFPQVYQFGLMGDSWLEIIAPSLPSLPLKTQLCSPDALRALLVKAQPLVAFGFLPDTSVRNQRGSGGDRRTRRIPHSACPGSLAEHGASSVPVIISGPLVIAELAALLLRFTGLVCARPAWLKHLCKRGMGTL